MFRDFIIFIPLSILYYSFKSTVLPSAPLPDLTLLIIIYVATRGVNIQGVLLAFILGYINDTFSGAVLGTSSFSFISVYALIHILSFRIQFVGAQIRAATAFSGELIRGALTLVILGSHGIEINFISTYLPTAIVTALFAPAILHLLRLTQSVGSKENITENIR